MNIPIFISFEVTDAETGYPYAIAWSLPNGQYKSVLVRPENDWLIDFETGNHNPDAPTMQDLLDQGQTVLDILKEWDHDFEDSELFCQDPVLAQYCMDMMYEAYGRECDLELISEYDCFEELDHLELDDQRRWIMDTEGLSASNCEDAVKTMIFLFARINSEQ
ncbi:MAG: hypothetical protein P8X89_17910 [Reinekea sp.]